MMIKRLTRFLVLLLISFQMILTVDAAILELDRTCTLTLTYVRNGEGFSDVTVEIYRVAEYSSNGTVKLTGSFSGYPIQITGISSQQQWKKVAETFRQVAASNGIEADCTQKTNAEGEVFFSDLKTGLYFVKGVQVQNEEGTFVFQDFMVFLPTPENNDYTYDVKAKPKYTEYTLPKTYTVVKLWEDASDASQRPDSIVVDLLKDGIVERSVVLDSANHWSYSWDVQGDEGTWSVMEVNVPQGYQVSIAKNAAAFVITNTKLPDKPETPEIPTTGDTSPMMMYLLLMCISGLGCLLLGFIVLREKKYEK